MSIDNRTELNDCNTTAGWTGNDTASTAGDPGQFFEGGVALSTQLTDSDEQMSTTISSAILTPFTFVYDMADSTIYMLVKCNLQKNAADGGIQFVLGDGTSGGGDIITVGYDIGGFDAPGMPLSKYYFSLKLDVSVIVAVPGVFFEYVTAGGNESALLQTAITNIGYGGILLAKSVGPIDNVFFDMFKVHPNAAATFTGDGANDLDFDGTGPDTITRNTGTSFITLGFTAGSSIIVTGSASNNGTFIIASLTATVITVTAGDLVTETNVAATLTQTNFALTVNGGTSGTPETMTDLVGDDIAAGWGLVSNPFGSTYLFFGPTEWGNLITIAEHAFEATDESWFLYGDNGGGHTIAATHFPFRFISNSTDTGEIKLTNVIITGLGRRSEWEMDNADFNTIELLSCTFNFMATIALPSSGGTSRSTLLCTFANCDAVTNNGADMTGSSVLLSNVAADLGALVYNETADPDGTLDDMTFSQGTNDHHAITFGTAVTSDITLRGIAFTGFDQTSGEDQAGAALLFLAAATSLTCNLIGCTVDGGAAATSSNFFKDDAAGILVTLSFDPVTTLINVADGDGADLQNARVLFEAADGTGDFPFEEVVTILRSGSVASVTHATHGLSTGDIVVIRGAVQPEYNGPFTITNVTAGAYDYTVSGTPDSPATARRPVFGQDELDYDDSPTSEGTFVGGTGHVALDVLILDRNVTILVDTVSSGIVTEFTVTGAGRGVVAAGDTLLQTQSDGAGVDFTLTLDTDNIAIASSGAIINGLTDVNGDVSATRTFGNNTPCKGFVRKSTAGTRFKSFTLSDTVTSASGLTINVRLTPDE